MSEKTLNFNNIRLNKKSKEPIDLLSVDVDQIVVFDKFKHNSKGFKHFIGYQEGETAKPFWIILQQMSGYIKYFENGGKLKMMNCGIDVMKFGMLLKIN